MLAAVRACRAASLSQPRRDASSRKGVDVIELCLQDRGGVGGGDEVVAVFADVGVGARSGGRVA